MITKTQNKKKSYFGQYKHNFNILNIKLDVYITKEKIYYDKKILKNVKILNEEYAVSIRENDTYRKATKEEYETIVELYKNSKDNHKCNNCSNACPSKCQKIADFDKQALEYYKFMPDALLLFNYEKDAETGEKYLNLHKFAIPQCLNFEKIDNKKKSGLSLEELKKARESLFSSYTGGGNESENDRTYQRLIESGTLKKIKKTK